MTADLIYTTARADGMPDALAKLIVAQARHETGNFSSNVFKTCNNLFGYKYVGQARASACTQSPELDNYAAYGSIEDSVHELTDWIKRRQRSGLFPENLSVITTPEQYAVLLKKSRYYGDSVTNYANGLRRFFAKYSGPLTFTGLLVTGVILLLLDSKR